MAVAQRINIDIDVWLFRLSSTADEQERLAGYLSPDEQARAARFVNPAHGVQYVIGRGRMREIIARYAGKPPAALRFLIGSAGKPSLEGTGVPSFNLSHTGDTAALAVSAVGDVGVDIETVRDITMDVARRFFSDAEVAALEALSPDLRVAAFYRCWTRKEAVVKALGDGMSFPLDAFDVSHDAAHPPQLLRLKDHSTADLHHWRLAHLGHDVLPPDIVGAVAIQAPQPVAELRLKFHQP
jgi:4'-phosphopantetheinyl transferase